EVHPAPEEHAPRNRRGHPQDARPDRRDQDEPEGRPQGLRRAVEEGHGVARGREEGVDEVRSLSRTLTLLTTLCLGGLAEAGCAAQPVLKFDTVSFGRVDVPWSQHRDSVFLEPHGEDGPSVRYEHDLKDAWSSAELEWGPSQVRLVFPTKL